MSIRERGLGIRERVIGIRERGIGIRERGNSGHPVRACRICALLLSSIIV